MTITTSQIGAILAKCSGYRPDKTPQPGELVIRAWHEHFAEFPHLTIDDAIEAVTRFHRDPHDRMIQPADISKIAREIRRDRTEREPDTAREARQAALDARLAEAVDAIGAMPTSPPKFIRASRRPDGHRNPLAVRCPWCRASEFRPCQIPGTEITMRGLHPARVELADAA